MNMIYTMIDLLDICRIETIRIVLKMKSSCTNVSNDG